MDRVAVVTGAGNGLGRAEAMTLAAQGFRVVVNDLGTSADGHGSDATAADAVVAEITDSGGTAVASYDSVATEAGAERIVALAEDTFGRVDVLVNNAGVIRDQPITQIVTDDWDAVIKTHLYGTFYCTRAASRRMKDQGYGRIVCTSSHVALGARDRATYSAAKEGITGFARGVARDLRDHGVTCNVIRPIATWRGKQHSDAAKDTLRPDDIAALVAYLAGEAAQDVNGCVFEVWAGHVGIFRDPPPVEQILLKDGHWTLDELTRLLPETLTAGRSARQLPRTMPPWLRDIE